MYNFRSKTGTQRILLLAVLATFAWASNAAAAPAIGSIEGKFENGVRVVIVGDGFTEKANPKPFFWWTADGGAAPSSLGRLTGWSGALTSGTEQSRVIVAPGSQYAFRFDHGRSSTHALGQVNFPVAPVRAYMWRKKYDDFDIMTDYGIRTDFDNLAGTLEVGQTVTGSRGATGVIQSVWHSPSVPGRGSIFYTVGEGSVGKVQPKNGAHVYGPEHFERGETLSTPTATCTNIEGLGTFFSFNYKVTRWWAVPTSTNNAYTGGQGSENRRQFRTTLEYTNPTTIWLNSDTLAQLPNEWANEQVVYERSDLDVANGRFWFATNNRFIYNNLAVTRTTAYPLGYREIFQSQVSNGAQEESWVYYDSIYIDDSWHRILASSSPSWDQARDVEIQIPVSWANDRVEFVARMGSLDTSKTLYLYVVDSENRVNQQGFPVVCANCPRPPDSIAVQ